jgi:hypothetical protein
VPVHVPVRTRGVTRYRLDVGANVDFDDLRGVGGPLDGDGSVDLRSDGVDVAVKFSEPAAHVSEAERLGSVRDPLERLPIQADDAHVPLAHGVVRARDGRRRERVGNGRNRFRDFAHFVFAASARARRAAHAGDASDCERGNKIDRSRRRAQVREELRGDLGGGAEDGPRQKQINGRPLPAAQLRERANERHDGALEKTPQRVHGQSRQQEIPQRDGEFSQQNVPAGGG